MSETLNLYGPMPDELLHSFIFRVLVRSGFRKECSSVVSQSGWACDPKLPPHCSWLFSVDIQPNLVMFFARTVGEKYVGNIFDSPLLSHHSFSKIFLNEKARKPDGLTLPINYCELCLREQILELGFTYFKSSWISSDRCTKHLRPLSLFQANKDVSCYGFISNPLGYRSDLRDENNYFEEFYSSNRSIFVSSEQKFKLALCAKRKLTKYFMNAVPFFQHDFFSKHSEDKYRLVSSMKTLSLTSWGLEAEYDRMLLDCYNKVVRLSPELLEQFFFYGLVEVEYKYFDNVGLVASKLMKDKGSYCEVCKHCFEVAERYNPASILEIVS